jgi:hypothetical protein
MGNGNGESHEVTPHTRTNSVLTTWAEMADDYVPGPHVIQDHLSGAQYSDILEGTIQLFCTRACGFNMTLPSPF